MLPLPSNKARYRDEMLNNLTPTERQAAAVYGVGKQFLKFASEEFISDKYEQYEIHKFHSVLVVQDDIKIQRSSLEQLNDVMELLDSGILWCDPAGLIIINSPCFLFEGDKDPYSGPIGFFNHLLCSLAYRVVQGKTPARNIEVNLLETMQIDLSKDYHLKPEHLLLYGPITEHSSAYDYTKAIQFLFTFRNYTRILLTSTYDLGELLSLLKVHINNVSYFFNFGLPREVIPTTKTKTKTQEKTSEQEKLVKQVRKTKKVTKKKTTFSIGI